MKGVLRSFFIGLLLLFAGNARAWHTVLADTHERIAIGSLQTIDSFQYPDVYHFFTSIRTGADTESHNTAWNRTDSNNALNGGYPKAWWDDGADVNGNQDNARYFYKNFKLGQAYTYIGRMIHLVQDQGVPAHGANIYHSSKLYPWDWDPYGDNLEKAARTHYLYPGVASQKISGKAPDEYYGVLLNATFDKVTESNTNPTSTWRRSAENPYWLTDIYDDQLDDAAKPEYRRVGWGSYGGGTPGNREDVYDWAISPSILNVQVGDSIKYAGGALMAASELLPPLISTFSITSGDVNGPAGAQISFTVMENRLPDVKIDLYVQETSQPVITNGLIKQLPYNQSDNGREYYDYSPDTAAWTAKDLSLYPTLSSDLELLPQMAQFQLAWSGEVVGAPLTPREEPYTLAMRVTDHDGNTDKYSHQFIVRPDVTPPTVRWTSTDIYGTQVPHQVTGANTLETAPWFHIGYDTGTYISFQFQDAGTGVGNFSIYSPSAGEGPGAPLFSAAFRSGQSFLLSDFTLQNDAAGYLLAATDALGNATTLQIG